ncbi:hypothetical protein WJX74_009958 [Apatococcus lobatus]|uniref:Cyclic phosphodiesterase n=1 Tax=Apatococcus lobatus TaxID=904363 RepID=A0AAW1RF43_9CHLO
MKADQGSAVQSYSIWAQPSGVLANRLQTEIDHLAGLTNEAPSFLPHVTVVAGVEGTEQEVLQRATEAAAQIQKYVIGFESVSYGKMYFQCVYMLCEPSRPTLAAAAAARRVFGKDKGDHYMPHLSLLYSDIQVAQRAQIAEALQARLMTGTSTTANPLPEKSFLVDTLNVWLTPAGDKSLKSWKLVKQIPLH